MLFADVVKIVGKVIQRYDYKLALQCLKGALVTYNKHLNGNSPRIEETLNLISIKCCRNLVSFGYSIHVWNEWESSFVLLQRGIQIKMANVISWRKADHLRRYCDLENHSVDKTLKEVEATKVITSIDVVLQIGRCAYIFFSVFNSSKIINNQIPCY